MFSIFFGIDISSKMTLFANNMMVNIVKKNGKISCTSMKA